MQRANVVGVALFAVGAWIRSSPAHAQAILGVDLDLFSSYVWRGISLTNKPVAQPALYVSFPAGNAEVSVGGWASIDLGKYDDLADDISESGGSSGFNFAEFDPYGEISFPVGKATLTGGVTAYIYPNDENAPNDFFLLTSDANTVAIYGKVGLDAPLSPELSVYYDVDKIKGAYIEGALSHSLPLSEKASLDLGALAGLSAGQGVSDDPEESANFVDDGFTHLDLSAGIPFTAGAFSLTPVLHLQINGDEITKITSPSNLDKDVKVWGGVSISWSRALGEEASWPLP
jgi:uncharacterized protein Gcw-chp